LPWNRSDSAWIRRAIDWSNETIATSSERLDEHWSVRRFAQRIAQPLDGGIQAMIEVNEGILRPEFAAQFFSGNDFSRAFKQSGQHLQRLFLELYLLSPLAELSGLKINLKRSEAGN
jgi:hypothetical protein